MALTSKELIERLPEDVQQMIANKAVEIATQLGCKHIDIRDVIARLPLERQKKIYEKSAEINSQRANARRREMEQPS